MSSPFHRLAALAPKPEPRTAGPRGNAAFTGSGDYRTLDIVALFSAHGLYGRDLGGGKHAVRCPNHAQHSDDRRAEDSDTVIYEARGDGFPNMHCLHAHCGHLDDFREMLKFFPDADRYCGRAWQPVRTVASTEVVPLPEPPPEQYPPLRGAEPLRVPEPPALELVDLEDDSREDLAPLPDNEVAPFPVQAFPMPVRQLVEEAAHSINVPLDFVGLPALIAMASALGNSRAIRIKPGWIERPVLWGIVIGRPGDAKTPSYKEALAPIDARQTRLHNKWKNEHTEWQEDFERYEQDLANWRRRMAAYSQSPRNGAPGEPPVKPEEPDAKQVKTTNATLEALNHLLYRNPRGVLLHQDEIKGWVGNMNAYRGGKGGDLQAWLEFWSSSTVVLNRRGEKAPLQIDAPFITVTGTIQPDVLPELAEDRNREDGFLHRILFSYPDFLPLTYTDNGVTGETQKGYAAVIDALYALEPDHEEPGLCDPQIVDFTEQAYQVWRRWIDTHLAEMNDLDFPEHLRGPWAKLKGYCARMALVIHCARYVCHETDTEDVDARSMKAAAALVTYFKSHARRVYSRLHASDEEKAAQTLLEWLKRRGGTATARDIYRANAAGIKSAEEAALLMRALERRGHARLEQGTKNKLTIRLKGGTVGSSPDSDFVPSAGEPQARKGATVGSVSSVQHAPPPAGVTDTPDTSAIRA